MKTKYEVVFVLQRGSTVLNVYDSLDKAQDQFPGTWEESPHRHWTAPNEWFLGDARILKLAVL